jgi:hypothetical protein
MRDACLIQQHILQTLSESRWRHHQPLVVGQQATAVVVSALDWGALYKLQCSRGQLYTTVYVCKRYAAIFSFVLHKHLTDVLLSCVLQAFRRQQNAVNHTFPDPNGGPNKNRVICRFHRSGCYHNGETVLEGPRDHPAHSWPKGRNVCGRYDPADTRNDR